MQYDMTSGWSPAGLASGLVFDAVVSLDFLEHCININEWVVAIKAALKPRGLFFCQNAFGIGSGPSGSIPMHLQCNDRYEKDWDPLLASMGFTQLGSNWYQAPMAEALTAA